MLSLVSSYKSKLLNFSIGSNSEVNQTHIHEILCLSSTRHSPLNATSSRCLSCLQICLGSHDSSQTAAISVVFYDFMECLCYRHPDLFATGVGSDVPIHSFAFSAPLCVTESDYRAFYDCQDEDHFPKHKSHIACFTYLQSISLILAGLSFARALIMFRSFYKLRILSPLK